MPHKQKHRGARNQDSLIFNDEWVPTLKEAVYDYSFLLTRGYSEDAIFKIVGDRYQLSQRQRMGVMRCSCSDQSLTYRKHHNIKLEQVKDHILAIDGFNLLITIESALSGGFIFEGRDGCYRDLASIHSTYKRVEETLPALQLIGNFLEAYNIRQVLWYLDKPVSNSGRLKTYIQEMADQHQWNWSVDLAYDPDKALKKNHDVVVSNDGVVLDGCRHWVNLPKYLIDEKITQHQLVSLGI